MTLTFVRDDLPNNKNWRGYCPVVSLQAFLYYFFVKWPTSVSISFIFGLFQTNVTFLQQINVKKYPSSMQCWHVNPRPFDHESPNITTTPGQPNLTQVSI